ncbi:MULTISPECIES: hypothetical protein [Paeniglutamicibacter]|uniref:hypothetical protein n=1 Tax=Paeniglutamicibacter TaxID=1742990 RepID=UPI0021F76B95|nr:MULTISPECIES: hypothetical protein [Paeniglutamicibacter]MCV9993164.1 hypothetical protein [Paeniglutamicibacter sp. ZC-3]MDO2933990.1 hypothetical protein [Paeniglutamicibacter sulfureus]
MATLFHRHAQTAVHHHGGGSIILGGILAVLLFAVFAVFLFAAQGAWEPMLIGIAFGLSAVLFGTVYHFTH